MRTFAERSCRWQFDTNVDFRMAYNHYFGRAAAPAKGTAAAPAKKPDVRLRLYQAAPLVGGALFSPPARAAARSQGCSASADHRQF